MDRGIGYKNTGEERIDNNMLGTESESLSVDVQEAKQAVNLTLPVS